MDIIIASGLLLIQMIRFELNAWLGIYVSKNKY